MKTNKRACKVAGGLLVATTLAAGLSAAASPAQASVNDSIPPSQRQSHSAGAGKLLKETNRTPVKLPGQLQELLDNNRRGVDKAGRNAAKAALENVLEDKVSKEAQGHLGKVLGPIAGFGVSMGVDFVFGHQPDSQEEAMARIMESLSNLNEHLDKRFQETEATISRLQSMADQIQMQQADNLYAKYETDLLNNEIARLNRALDIQRDVVWYMNKPSLTEGDVSRMKELVDEFQSISAEVSNDLPDYTQKIAGSNDQSVGVIAAYQQAVVGNGTRRFINAEDYQSMKAEAVRWQIEAVLAASVAKEGHEMAEENSGEESTDHNLDQFLAAGGGMDHISNEVPVSDWAPVDANGKADPNADYLVDTKTGDVVYAAESMKGVANYWYVPRKLNVTNSSEDGARRNEPFKHASLKGVGTDKSALPGNQPTLSAGSLLSGLDLAALPKHHTSTDRTKIESSDGSATSSLLSSWRPDSTVSTYFNNPKWSDQPGQDTLYLGAIPGTNYTDKWSKNGFATYHENFEMMGPDSQGAIKEYQGSTEYSDSPCGLKHTTTHDMWGFRYDHWITPDTCPTADWAHMSSGSSTGMRPSLAVWFVAPEGKDSYKLNLNLVGIPRLK